MFVICREVFASCLFDAKLSRVVRSGMELCVEQGIVLGGRHKHTLRACCFGQWSGKVIDNRADTPSRLVGSDTPPITVVFCLI